MTDNRGSFRDGVEGNFLQSFRIASEVHKVSYGGNDKGAWG